MLELTSIHPVIWSVHATEEACDLVMRAPGACRVAVDEVMVLAVLPDDVKDAVLKIDEDAVIIETTDGWTGLVLSGEDVADAFARLSELKLPEDGYIQGDVARVPVRVVTEPSRIAFFVPAMWGDHLRERILADGSRLGVREVST